MELSSPRPHGVMVLILIEIALLGRLGGLQTLNDSSNENDYDTDESHAERPGTRLRSRRTHVANGKMPVVRRSVLARSGDSGVALLPGVYGSRCCSRRSRILIELFSLCSTVSNKCEVPQPTSGMADAGVRHRASNSTAVGVVRARAGNFVKSVSNTVEPAAYAPVPRRNRTTDIFWGTK
jgi:hypothetical protein